MRLCYHFRSWDYSIHCAPVSTERRQYPRDFGAFQWMLTQAERHPTKRTLNNLTLKFSFHIRKCHIIPGFKNVKRRPWVRPWRKLIKAELMLPGFISLLITVGTRAILKICIPEKYENLMLPCKNDYAGDSYEDKNGGKGGDGDDGGDNKRKLLSFAGNLSIHRVLAAAAAGGDYCSDGKASLISQTGLHIFIFVLAIFHALYSVVTMALAQAKMKKWKAWEEETSSLEYQFTNDPTRFRLARQTSFVRRHSGISAAPGIKWIVAFFRQFTGSVTKVDYMTMRHGFIKRKFPSSSKFDFHRYIKRCMEDHFKQVVGISMPLWGFFAILFLLLNVYRWYTFTWLAVVPLVVTLAVGTKLQAIIAKMAIEIKERHAVVQGIPLVQVSDRNFWFSWPELVLYLIHFVLFQNAFELTYFLWAWYEFGKESCVNQDTVLIIVRVTFGVGAQVLCSYATLPLYALVTQMGSTMKRSIFDQQTSKALKSWHQKAVKKTNEVKPDQLPTRTLGGSPDASSVHSPSPTRSPPDKFGIGSPRFSDVEAEAASRDQHTANITAIVDVELNHLHRPGDNSSPFVQRDLLS
ncbi:MLO-LIKE PROTEIN [Salix koriyanagi]|uniref:MLO-like protein n=1 Tax=Salix koriyanagi TaxID=2511006 RepID=A0A9Q0QKW1_9ROSI|nr:MLO-LIKE PROTEIN [Salix koriyanagi]